jgi:hypothetical protein
VGLFGYHCLLRQKIKAMRGINFNYDIIVVKTIFPWSLSEILKCHPVKILVDPGTVPISGLGVESTKIPSE